MGITIDDLGILDALDILGTIGILWRRIENEEGKEEKRGRKEGEKKGKEAGGGKIKRKYCKF